MISLHSTFFHMALQKKRKKKRNNKSSERKKKKQRALDRLRCERVNLGFGDSGRVDTGHEETSGDQNGQLHGH